MSSILRNEPIRCWCLFARPNVKFSPRNVRIDTYFTINYLAGGTTVMGQLSSSWDLLFTKCWASGCWFTFHYNWVIVVSLGFRLTSCTVHTLNISSCYKFVVYLSPHLRIFKIQFSFGSPCVVRPLCIPRTRERVSSRFVERLTNRISKGQWNDQYTQSADRSLHALAFYLVGQQHRDNPCGFPSTGRWKLFYFFPKTICWVIKESRYDNWKQVQ